MAALDSGHEAPGFLLADVKDGEKRGPAWDRLTLLVFFKVTCPTCQLAMPYIERFSGYAKSGLEIWTVVEDPAEAAHLFAKEYGISLRMLTEPLPYRVSSAYGLTNVPTLFLVERGGRVAANIVGFSKDGYNTLSEDIARRLGADVIEICPAEDGAPVFKPG